LSQKDHLFCLHSPPVVTQLGIINPGLLPEELFDLPIILIQGRPCLIAVLNAAAPAPIDRHLL
jgi:hypothetical protein